MFDNLYTNLFYQLMMIYYIRVLKKIESNYLIIAP